jgi:hypothetical protein
MCHDPSFANAKVDGVHRIRERISHSMRLKIDYTTACFYQFSFREE